MRENGGSRVKKNFFKKATGAKRLEAIRASGGSNNSPAAEEASKQPRTIMTENVARLEKQ